MQRSMKHAQPGHAAAMQPDEEQQKQHALELQQPLQCMKWQSPQQASKASIT